MKVMSGKALIVLATLLVSGAFAQTLAYAQEAGHLRLTTVVQKEEVTTTATGERKTELIAANKVVPGESVVYTITFENVSDESADDITITNPVPEHLSYVPGSAFGPGAVIEFSVDGGRQYAAPDALFVADNGEIRPAAAEDYTHIRWVLQDELASGAQGMARFRARLN